jgi:hypothetical protein
VAAIRSRSEAVSLSADPARPDPRLGGRGGPAFEISSRLRGCRQALASQVLVSTRIDSGLKSYKDETPPAMRGQHGCLRAFAGMTPVAMATATACVKFMQLNLWRAVSR